MAVAQKKQETVNETVKAFDAFCREFNLPKDIFGGPGALSTTLLSVKKEAGNDQEALRNGMLRYLYRQIRDDPQRYDSSIGPEKSAQIRDAYVSLVRGSSPIPESQKGYAKMTREELAEEYDANLEIAKTARGALLNQQADPAIRLDAFENVVPGAISNMKAIVAELRSRDPQDPFLADYRAAINDLSGFLEETKKRLEAGVKVRKPRDSG